MVKEKKSASELEAIILDRSLQAGMNLQSVTVYRSSIRGWEANFVADTPLVLRYTELFDGIVRELREQFELA
jgi:hypothetical protein